MHINTDQQNDVLSFINNLYDKAKSYNLNIDNFRSVFTDGYCYYFACMLKEAFNRGEICICAPYGHIVWVDNDNTMYDAYGIKIRDDESLVPVTAPDSHIDDFKHIKTESKGISKEELDILVEKYKYYNPNNKK